MFNVKKKKEEIHFLTSCFSIQQTGNQNHIKNKKTQKQLTQQSRWWWAAARSGWWCPRTSSSPPPTWWSRTWRSQSRSPRGKSPSLPVSVCQRAKMMSVRGKSRSASVCRDGLEKFTSTRLCGDCWSVSLNIWWSALTAWFLCLPACAHWLRSTKNTSHASKMSLPVFFC